MEEKENMIRREKCLVDQKDEMLERNEGLIICFSILLVVYEREMEECPEKIQRLGNYYRN